MSLYARATFKLVGQADDWRPIGATVLSLHLWTGCGAGLLLLALAGPIASALGEPLLAVHLRLFSLDIPLFTVAQAHRNILIGIGDFRSRALASAGRWTVRLVLIILFVKLGYGITGAIWGCIGASVADLAIGRFYVRPSWRRSSFPVRQLMDYAVPLLLSGICMRLFDKLDLFLLKVMGASAEQAGFYGAAQNLAIVPAIFSLAFAPLLLSTLSRLLRESKREEAKQMSRQALRLSFLLLSLVGIVAGAATEIVGLIFGAQFLSAAPLLAWLFGGATALSVIAVATTILTAVGKPGWTVTLAVPMVLVAGAGHMLAIPRLGPIGAAQVTTGVAVLGAVASIMVMQHFWRLSLPLATLGRSLMLGGLGYVLADFQLVAASQIAAERGRHSFAAGLVGRMGQRRGCSASLHAAPCDREESRTR